MFTICVFNLIVSSHLYKVPSYQEISFSGNLSHICSLNIVIYTFIKTGSKLGYWRKILSGSCGSPFEFISVVELFCFSWQYAFEQVDGVTVFPTMSSNPSKAFTANSYKDNLVAWKNWP